MDPLDGLLFHPFIFATIARKRRECARLSPQTYEALSGTECRYAVGFACPHRWQEGQRVGGHGLGPLCRVIKEARRYVDWMVFWNGSAFPIPMNEGIGARLQLGAYQGGQKTLAAGGILCDLGFVLFRRPWRLGTTKRTQP